MAKTDWTMNDTVMPEDMNDIGQEINELHDLAEAAVPLDGSAVMTGDLVIAKNEPALVLKDLNDDYYSKIICDLDAVFIEQRRVSDDSYVATRIKIDLTTGEIYAGDASKIVWHSGNDSEIRSRFDVLDSDPANPPIGYAWIVRA